MKNLGIIAEYNPFHNGHLFHLKESLKQSNCDNCICIMSGNFIQRGLPALYDKWIRTEMALKAGVDLVIELPTYYAVNSAEAFAFGSIKILNELGIIDNVCFGAENNDFEALNDIANILVTEPLEYTSLLKKYLDTGISYPKARSEAISNFTGNKNYANILSKSNNILSIEYLKAIKKLNSKIIATPIKREKSNYNDTHIDSEICSATAIRELLENSNFANIKDKLKNVVPDSTYNIISNNVDTTYLKQFEKEIFFKLHSMSLNDLSNILEVNEGLENRLKKLSFEYTDIYQLIDAVKSKRYTQTKIQRILIHCLLDMTKQEFDLITNANENYVRVLGLNSKGKKLLKEISKNSNIPIISSVSKYLKSSTSTKLIEKDILSSNIYCKKYNIDYTKKIIEI